MQRNLEATILFIDFSKIFNSIHRWKMELVLLAYGLSKETVTAIIMLNKNMKAIVCLSDGDTNFFDIVSGVLRGDTLVPYTFIICVDYVIQMLVNLIKENDFTLKER